MNRKTKRIVIILIPALLIFGFFLNQINPGPDTEESVPFTTIEKGSYSGYREQAQALIFKESGLLEFGIENSGIDFSSTTALFVSMGERNSGGYSIEIESIARVNGRLHVNVMEKSPGSNCATTAAFTQPYHLVVFDSSVTFSDVSFTSHSVVVDCDD